MDVINTPFIKNFRIPLVPLISYLEPVFYVQGSMQHVSLSGERGGPTHVGEK